MPNMIVSVATMDGKIIEHTYELPDDVDEWDPIIGEVSDLIFAAFSDDNSSVRFDSPFVRYRTSFIGYIRVRSSAEATAAVEKHIGFLKKD